MCTLENRMSEFESLSEQKLYYSGISHIICHEYCSLFAGIFCIEYSNDLYDRIYNKFPGILMNSALVLQPLYDIYHNTWERKWYLVHLLNTIRVMQDRRQANPICDNQFRIQAFEEVLPNVQRVILENSHFDLDAPHQKLLEVSVTNYFLRQVNYPSVMGKNIVSAGLSSGSLKDDLLEVSNIWLK